MAEGGATETFHWWQFSFTLRNREWSEHVQAHPLVIVRAMVLESKPARYELDPVFTVRRDAGFVQRLQRDETLTVDVVLAGAEREPVFAWHGHFLRLLARGPHFDATPAAPPTRHDTSADITRFLPPADLGDEVCLHFDTPFAFDDDTRSGTLDFRHFRSILTRRLSRAFPQHALALPANDLVALGHYWHIERGLRHVSRSDGEAYGLIGFRGPYYLRGNVGLWWPWLKLAEVLHLGKRVPFGLGSFRLLHRCRPSLSRHLAEPGRLRHALEHVLENHDAAHAEIAATTPSPFDPMDYCKTLAERIATGRFEPGTYDAIDLPKPNGGTRRIEQPGLDALVVATHVHNLLDAPLDRQFEPQSYGFRKARSREDAALAIDAALADGYRWVIETDIADFFGTIDRTVLGDRLRAALPRADGAAADLAMMLVGAPFRAGGAVHARKRGIPQGLPLSPLLANLYLDPLDEQLAAHDVRVVRYADDLVVLCRSEQGAQALLDELRRDVAALGLALADEKTQVVKASEGFTFLGLRFPRTGGESQWQLPLRRALHVIEPFLSLGVRGDALEIRQAGAVRDVIPMRRLDHILLHAPAVLSTALIRKASAQAEPVAIAACSARDGDAMLLTPVNAEAFDVAHRQASRYEAMSESARDAIAREWVVAKIENATAFLRTRYRAGMNQRLAQLEGFAASVHAAGSIDEIRGIEGAAAREVFAEINAQIEVPEFRFRRRDRAETDRMNPLFNFVYYLLLQHIQLELRGLGLNPYLGFLHRPLTGRRYEALSCDVQEPFRSHVDRLLLRLINLKAIRPEHVDLSESPPRIAREALHTIVEHFERELNARPQRTVLSLAESIAAQCINLRDFLCEGRSFYVYRWPKKPAR